DRGRPGRGPATRSRDAFGTGGPPRGQRARRRDLAALRRDRRGVVRRNRPGQERRAAPLDRRRGPRISPDAGDLLPGPPLPARASLLRGPPPGLARATPP